MKAVISLADVLQGASFGTWTLRPLVARHLAHSSLVVHGSFKLSSIFVILPLYFPLEWLRQSITTLVEFLRHQHRWVLVDSLGGCFPNGMVVSQVWGARG
jgi:hypothetical protein